MEHVGFLSEGHMQRLANVWRAQVWQGPWWYRRLTGWELGACPSPEWRHRHGGHTGIQDSGRAWLTAGAHLQHHWAGVLPAWGSGVGRWATGLCSHMQGHLSFLKGALWEATGPLGTLGSGSTRPLSLGACGITGGAVAHPGRRRLPPSLS